MAEKCGAAKRQGGDPCGRPAGWGTDHTGTGACKLHGGSTSTGRKAAKRKQAVQAVAMYGLPRAVDPHDALLEELHRTAGHVAWLGTLIAEGERADLKQYAPGGSTTNDDGDTSLVLWEKPSIWLELYHRERRHFADVAKTCIGVGIEERRVRVAEQQGALLAQVIRGILSDLGVADRPEVPDVVRRHLTLVSSAA